MLDISQPRMLHPSSSPSSLGPSPLHDMLALDSKVPSGHLYVREPHAIQIIQLVEASPPPPHNISSVIQSTSAGSSYPSTSESEEEECSSYCSSVVTPDDSSQDREPIPWTDDTYDVRMKRVHLWRDSVTDASSSCSSPLKRKLNLHHTDDDNSSCYPSKRPYTTSRSSGYICPACDVPFLSQPSLHLHACMPPASEACRAAVNYHFE
ncbi:hypothetical protein BKA82DRAFT_1007401 [Pisolithus tinctorius]|uniref:Uncharacterized protein n=1 Tax=Pisolithus tinctorius Marx 270 TaxID=870435 RepID=A0A0C3NJH7_PISTI|nr:hypothetical protein BKA82DRAFT_1007401 [Pisolithus tinctorius]KIN95533.1 hypothetical protein M404DRAFT_1007401 [Pisolithus tinctorius Marx 270]